MFHPKLSLAHASVNFRSSSRQIHIFSSRPKLFQTSSIEFQANAHQKHLKSVVARKCAPLGFLIKNSHFTMCALSTKGSLNQLLAHIICTPHWPPPAVFPSTGHRAHLDHHGMLSRGPNRKRDDYRTTPSRVFTKRLESRKKSPTPTTISAFFQLVAHTIRHHLGLRVHSRIRHRRRETARIARISRRPPGSRPKSRCCCNSLAKLVY